MNEQELKARLSALPDRPRPADINTWDFYRWQIRDQLLSDDPRTFLRWPTIQKTMFSGDCDPVRLMLHFVFKTKRGIGRSTDRGFGSPPMLVDYRAHTGNSIRQAYFALQAEKQLKIGLDSLKTIVEFGGGYGMLAYIARRLGFIGKYHIYDLSELCLLQEYYLSNVGATDYTCHPITGVDDITPPGPPVDLLVGVYSLSEAPAATRVRFFDAMQPRYSLIARQDVYEKDDLNEWFNKFRAERKQYKWTVVPSTIYPGHTIEYGVLRPLRAV